MRLNVFVWLMSVRNFNYWTVVHWNLKSGKIWSWSRNLHQRCLWPDEDHEIYSSWNTAILFFWWKSPKLCQLNTRPEWWPWFHRMQEKLLWGLFISKVYLWCNWWLGNLFIQVRPSFQLSTCMYSGTLAYERVSWCSEWLFLWHGAGLWQPMQYKWDLPNDIWP